MTVYKCQICSYVMDALLYEKVKIDLLCPRCGNQNLSDFWLVDIPTKETEPTDPFENPDWLGGE